MGGILKSFGAMHAEAHKLASRVDIAGKGIAVGGVFVQTLKANSAVVAVQSS